MFKCIFQIYASLWVEKYAMCWYANLWCTTFLQMRSPWLSILDEGQGGCLWWTSLRTMSHYTLFAQLETWYKGLKASQLTHTNTIVLNVHLSTMIWLAGRLRTIISWRIKWIWSISSPYLQCISIHFIWEVSCTQSPSPHFFTQIFYLGWYTPSPICFAEWGTMLHWCFVSCLIFGERNHKIPSIHSPFPLHHYICSAALSWESWRFLIGHSL